MRSLGSILALGAALSAPTFARSQQLPARQHHTQTTLTDGRVLLAGGEHSDDLVAWGSGSARALRRETFLFDPATGRWSGAGSLTRPRTGHDAVALPDGSVLVLGGGTGGRPDPTIEQWLPGSNAWRAVGRLLQARLHGTATVLADGRVLVVGGARDDVGGAVPGENVLSGVEVWDPVTRRSQAASPLPVALVNHAAVRLTDGRVLVAGGASWWGGASPSTEVASARAFVWHPTSGAWREVGAMSGARSRPAMTLLRDGRVLVVGNRAGRDQSSCPWTDTACASRPVRGDDAELFDPTTETFTRTAPTRFPRLGDHQLAPLSDGRVAVFGVCAGSCFQAPQVIEVWDPGSGTWSDHGDLARTSQEGFRATSLGDGRVLVTGAVLAPDRSGRNRAESSFEVWNPATTRARQPPRESAITPSVLE